LLSSPPPNRHKDGLPFTVSDTPLHFKTVAELSSLLANGSLTSVALTEAVITRTLAVEDRVQAFNSHDRESALNQAKASDARRAAPVGRCARQSGR
jgi:Asp-tRNA(Asn)/Glu-tRNA(Gln) amidotransferase A subunit family amidase